MKKKTVRTAFARTFFNLVTLGYLYLVAMFLSVRIKPPSHTKLEKKLALEQVFMVLLSYRWPLKHVTI